MVTLVIEHGLEEWDAWKGVFDEHAASRKEHGCIREELFRAGVVGEPRITFWDTVETTEF